MADTTKGKLVKAIESLADKVTGNIDANDALKYTQAALNAANTIITLSNVKRDE